MQSKGGPLPQRRSKTEINLDFHSTVSPFRGSKPETTTTPDLHRSTCQPSSQPRAPLKSNQGRFFAFRNVLSTRRFSRPSSGAFCEFLPPRREREAARRSNHRQQLSPAPPSTMSPTTTPSTMSPSATPTSTYNVTLYDVKAI